MTIASQISRLQNDKAAICTAIENKGVTVGNVTLDSYAACIDAIEQGGGGVEIMDVCYSVLGGGGGGGGTSCSTNVCRVGGGGGGAGAYISGKAKIVAGVAVPIGVGCGGSGGEYSSCYKSWGHDGGYSYFGEIIAPGGGGGGSAVGSNTTSHGRFGGSGGGGGGGQPHYGRGGGGICDNAGGSGSSNCCGGGGGGGGANGYGCGGGTNTGCWGGIGVDIEGYGLAGGGGTGGGFCSAWSCELCYGGGNGGVGCCSTVACRNGKNACRCGAGGGGGGGCGGVGGAGAGGLVIVSYPTACGYNIVGGEKVTCGDKIIHCFTGEGAGLIFPIPSGGLSEKIIGYLAVGGGASSRCWGGGGGGEVLAGAMPIANSVNITIGAGGKGCANICNGGDTTLGDITAKGGTAGLCIGGTSGSGYEGGGLRGYCCGSGGGGAGGRGGYAGYSVMPLTTMSGNGGRGLYGYGGGGAGLMGQTGYGRGVDGGGGHLCSYTTDTNATNYGGGGGASTSWGGCGCQGVVDICYPTDGSFGFTTATGGDSCYTCNGMCVHRFTSNGTFTIVS